MCQGKAHPITGNKGPEVEKRYSPNLYLTSVLDGGGWSMPWPGHFMPGKDALPIM
jgi:hypothetical protein